MSLIIGATGDAGRHVVPQLLRTGVVGRALTRNFEPAVLPGNVDVVRGDLSVPDALGA